MEKVVIQEIRAYEVLDSRGNPTLGVEVFLSDGTQSIAFVPSGASTGQYEARERRDCDDKRFGGKGVLKAASTINKDINFLLRKLEPTEQQEIDSLMCQADGSDNKINYGANAILGVSIACAKAAAQSLNLDLFSYLNHKANEIFDQEINKRLPVPMMNILNGGVHADNPIDFQEFMIQPIGFNNFKRSIQCGVEIFHTLKGILKKKNLSTSIGDEGGFAPHISSPDEALNLIIEAIELSGYKPEREVMISLDVAASELYKGNKYILKGLDKKFSSTEFIDYLSELTDNYPISSIEDGLAEDDWQGWTLMKEKLGRKIQLVGDDLFVTNSERLKRGIDCNAANAVLIKINQIGTITETLKTINLAISNNYKTVISHRSGETEDTTIADLAVAVGAGQIKTGAPCRSDRNAKYNRLLIIEEKFNLNYLGRNELN